MMTTNRSNARRRLRMIPEMSELITKWALEPAEETVVDTSETVSESEEVDHSQGSPPLSPILGVDGSSQTLSPLPDTSVSPTPPPPPSPVDESTLDGLMSSLITRLVRAAFDYLLKVLVNKIRKEECYGCTVEHPSQRQHECLDILEEDFFESNARMREIRERLLNRNFIPGVIQFLNMYNIHVEESRVSKIVETLMTNIRYPDEEEENNFLSGQSFRKNLETLGSFWGCVE